jgi:hypothetical protein
MDLTNYTYYFPSISEPHISRDNLVKYIENCFSSNVDVVTIEGEESVGKTILLAEYAKTFNDKCISYFIPSVNKTTCDPEVMLLDIANQLNLFIFGKEIDLSEVKLDLVYQRLLFESDKNFRRTGKKIIIVLDGLEHLEGQYEHARNIILTNLPIGRKSFGLLLSGNPAVIGVQIDKGIQHRTVTVVGFTFEETKRFLGKHDDTVYSECFRISAGKPGLLASLNRVLKTEGEIPPNISGKQISIDKLYEFEWNKLSNKSIEKALALMIFGKRNATINEIADMIEVENVSLQKILSDLSFIRTNKDTGVLEFVSDSFGRFAAGKLKQYQNDALDLTISSLLKIPQSQESILNLPMLLFQAGKYDKLIEYVDEEYLPRYLARTSSLAGLRKRIELAAIASQKLSREKELFKYSLQSALVLGCQMSEMWRDEIEALIALDNYNGALVIVQSISNPDIRFHMLIVLAKEVRKHKLPIDPSIDETIKQIFGQLDFASIGKEKVLEIATDLVYSNPEMAFEMLNRVAPTNQEGNSYDQLLSQLAFNASVESPDDTVALEKIKDKISDPDAKTISSAILAMTTDYTAEDILSKTDEIKDISLKLLLLRKWTIRNARREDAFIVVNKGLHLSIAATEYNPNALIFRELSEPLPCITDHKTAITLVRIIDAQLGNIQNKGPIEEYIKLLLILAHTIWNFDKKEAQDRILNIYWEIGSINDVSIKVSCLSYLQSFIERIDKDRVLNKEEGLHAVLNEELPKEFEKLLISSAEHYDLAAVVLDSIGQYDVIQAGLYANQLNTQGRRDKAYRHIVLRHIRNLNYDIDLMSTLEVWKRIDDKDLKDDTLFRICQSISRISLRGLEKSEFAFQCLVENVKNIANYYKQCESLVYCYSFLVKSTFAKDWIKHEDIFSILIDVWNNRISSGWDKVILGYKIVRELCRGDKSNAIRFLELTEKERKNTILQSPELSSSIFYSLLITIRAFSGIVSQTDDLAKEYDRLIGLINSEESITRKAILFNDLALRLYLRKRYDFVEKAVNASIKPMLTMLKAINFYEYKTNLIECSPSLFVVHPSTYYLALEDLSSIDRDDAIMKVIDFLLTKVPNIDPFDSGLKRSFKITYEDAISICDLLKRIEQDDNIYFVIERLVGGFDSPESRNKFKREQIQSIAQKLSEIVDSKLPNKKYITHDGYKIIAKAQIARLTHQAIKYFDDLLLQSKGINNLADRAYVLTILGEVIPEEYYEKRCNALNEAYALANGLPSSIEKSNHLHLLSIASALFNPIQSKNYLKEAFEFVLKDPKMNTRERMKGIIDTAYRIDPEFASSLASLIVDDEATIEAKQTVRDRLELLKTKEQMMKGEGCLKKRIELMSRAAWRMLASLNSGRILPNHMDEITPYLTNGATLSIEVTYPIFSWILENAIHRLQSTPAAKASLWGLYEASVNTVEFLGGMNENTGFTVQTTTAEILQIHSENLIVSPGQRDLALKHIAKWWEESTYGKIILCDHYFELSELSLFSYLNSIKRKMHATIICGYEILEEIKPFREESNPLKAFWNSKISESVPPFIDLIILKTKGANDFPIHDRWLITEDSGLRIGTSINSLGITKVSEISRIEYQDFGRIKEMLFGYISRSIREHDGERIDYTIYSL